MTGWENSTAMGQKQEDRKERKREWGAGGLECCGCFLEQNRAVAEISIRPSHPPHKHVSTPVERARMGVLVGQRKPQHPSLYPHNTKLPESLETQSPWSHCSGVQRKKCTAQKKKTHCVPFLHPLLCKH